jgi:hypothetical protein
LVLGLLFGALIWVLWAMLRGKKSLATLYQPRASLVTDK